MVISFDIFDTLITRKTALPTGVFLQVQKDAGLPEDFAQMRICAEKDARMYLSQKGHEEITLQDIYELLSDRMERNLDDVMLLEMEIELKSIYPLWKQIDCLKNYLSEGNRVVLISDMYLDEQIIRKMLVSVDLVFEEIPIYVSSDYGKTKQSGALFLKVAELERVDFKQWTHYGDNHYSDCLVPKMLGIHAIPVEKQGMTVWEQRISDRLHIQSNLLLQYYIGTAKIIREEHTLNIPAKIGASLGAMTLFPYVQWILKQSAAKNIDRLYFMARDGYILKKIADAVIAYQDLQVQTKYIYSSRKAWRLEKYETEKREMLVRYLLQEMDFSDDKFALVDLHGTGLTIEYLVDILSDYKSIMLRVFYYDLAEKRSSDQYKLFSFCSDHSGLSELFCRAPHGATIGYELDGDIVKPCLQPVKNELWDQAGLNDYIYGIGLAADKLAQLCGCMGEMGSRELSEAALDYCRMSPDSDVLKFLGEMPHCNGVNETNIVFIPKLSAMDIFKIYMWRTIEPLNAVYSGFNLNLSLLRTEKKYIAQKEFWERHYNKILGRFIHRIKIGIVPFIFPKMRIVIYAAGKNGRALYAHLRVHPQFRVVAWADIDNEKYTDSGFPIVSCEEAIRKSFDFIVISLGNLRQSEEVKNNLINIGVDPKKIIFHKTFIELYLK